MMVGKATSSTDWVRARLSVCALFTGALFISVEHLRAEIDQVNQPTYQIRSNGERYEDRALTAVLDGRELTIYLPSDEGFFPFEVTWAGDFDGDGLIDAIVEIHNGGNCCPTQFFLIRYLGDKFFTISNELAISTGWSGYSLIEVDGEKVIRVGDQDLGVDQTAGREWMEDYALRDGKLIHVATHMNVASLRAEQELTAAEVRLRGGSASMSFDMDDDGIVDQILCSYWQRWGSLTCSAMVSSGVSAVIPACERIGILPTRTDGWSDLSCGHRTVLIYAAGEYRPEHD